MEAAMNARRLILIAAVLMRDFPVIMGILTIGSALTLLGNLLADLAYAWADPRVRRGVLQ